MTAPPPAHLTWVIGAGGLLGGALVKAIHSRRDGMVMTSRVNWADPHRCRAELADGIARSMQISNQCECPWRVAWCAGAGVTGTSLDVLKTEVTTLTAFLAELADQPTNGRSNLVFIASSAGGVYAGAHEAPYTEVHTPTPISDYGRAKLACEMATDAFARSSRMPVVVGRISNLYGPGQNLAKAQGLVSQLCRAHVTGQPVSIYVPLDTVRDYLFVDDCAAMIADALNGIPASERRDGATTKIFAASQGTTIGALIGECRRVFKRSPRVVLGTSANAKFQIRDLRMRSTVWPELDRRALMTIPAGIAATATGLNPHVR
jgi:UDP-glucose 4-epimerase